MLLYTLLNGSGLSKSYDTDVQLCNTVELVTEIAVGETSPSGFHSWKQWPLFSGSLGPSDELDIVTGL